MAQAQGWVTQTAQIGFATDASTHGADLQTDKFITNGTLTFSTVSSSKEVRSQGELAPNLVVPVKETSEWTLEEGAPCYNNMTYFLDMVLGKSTTTTGTGGTFEHTWDIKSNTELVTAALAFGDETDAAKILYAVASGFSAAWNIQNETSDFAASGFAKDVQLDATLSANPESITVSPIMPEHIQIYVASTRDDLSQATSIRDNTYGVEIEVADRYAPFATFNRGMRSFNHVITTLPDLTVSISQLNDADSRDWINKYREARVSYIRIEAEGKEIATGVKEKFVADFCIQATEQSQLGEDEDAKTIITPARLVRDANGFIGKITIVNSVGAISSSPVVTPTPEPETPVTP